MEKAAIQTIEDTVRSKLTTYGKFMFDSDRDLILCLRERLLFPKEEMRNISLFDNAYTEIGCVLSVKYFERGNIRYDIKRGDYDSFERWTNKYNDFMSHLEKETRRYVCCSLKNGFLIPFDKVSQNELNNLLTSSFVTIDNANGKKWYRIGAPDLNVFQKYINSYLD